MKFRPIYYLDKFIDFKVFIMNQDKKWMLITYYCPTHGDQGRIEPIEIKNNELRKNFLNKEQTRKKN